MGEKENPGEEQIAGVVYADIYNAPRWEPGSKHPRMSLHDRAAQFAPFAALVGYDEMVDEEARQTESWIDLAGEQQERLDQRIRIISDALTAGRNPELTFTFFVPDEKKAGGRYVSVGAKVRRIDPVQGLIFLIKENRDDIPESIRMDRLLTVEGTLLDSVEEALDYSSDS